MTLYLPDHRCQYDYSSFTAQNGCTWTSGATGADAATGGKVDLTPDQVKGKVKRTEETNPSSPGWSMRDLALAMARLGVPFQDRTGGVWADVVAALDRDGLFVVLQGDSDRFGDHTCSGAFNGDHAIGVHPAKQGLLQRIDDPICKAARYETRAVLRAYAEKLARSIGEYPRLRFGVFTTPVPDALPDTSTEEVVYSIPESDGPYPATVKAGTPLYGSATDKTANATLNDPSRPYTVVAAASASDTPTTGRRWLHGRYQGKPVVLGCVEVGRLVR